MLALIKRVNVQLTSNYTGLRCYALEADPSQLNESGYGASHRGLGENC